MKDTKTNKNYEQPEFQFVRQEEQNRVFFTASGEGPAVGGSIGTLTNVNGEW